MDGSTTKNNRFFCLNLVLKPLIFLRKSFIIFKNRKKDRQKKKKSILFFLLMLISVLCITFNFLHLKMSLYKSFKKWCCTSCNTVPLKHFFPQTITLTCDLIFLHGGLVQLCLCFLWCPQDTSQYKKFVSDSKRLSNVKNLPVKGKPRRCAYYSTKQNLHFSSFTYQTSNVGLCFFKRVLPASKNTIREKIENNVYITVNYVNIFCKQLSFFLGGGYRVQSSRPPHSASRVMLNLLQRLESCII